MKRGRGLNKKINPIKYERINKPKRRKRYSLEELIEGITPENNHDEIDPGIAVGNEVW